MSTTTVETVDRAADSGDHVVIDYLGRIDGEPFEGGEGRDQLLELCPSRRRGLGRAPATIRCRGGRSVMGMTMIEHLLSRKAGLSEVSVGDTVTVEVDTALAELGHLPIELRDTLRSGVVPTDRGGASA